MIKIIGFSPDLSQTTFLLKREEEKPAYGFLEWPRKQVEWVEGESEDSLFSKKGFFELTTPVEGKDLDEILAISEAIWKRYSEDSEVKQCRQKILGSESFSMADYEMVTTKLVNILRDLSEGMVKKNNPLTQRETSK